MVKEVLKQHIYSLYTYAVVIIRYIPPDAVLVSTVSLL